MPEIGAHVSVEMRSSAVDQERQMNEAVNRDAEQRFVPIADPAEQRVEQEQDPSIVDAPVDVVAGADESTRLSELKGVVTVPSPQSMPPHLQDSLNSANKMALDVNESSHYIDQFNTGALNIDNFIDKMDEAFNSFADISMDLVMMRIGKGNDAKENSLKELIKNLKDKDKREILIKEGFSVDKEATKKNLLEHFNVAGIGDESSVYCKSETNSGKELRYYPHLADAVADIVDNKVNFSELVSSHTTIKEINNKLEDMKDAIGKTFATNDPEAQAVRTAWASEHVAEAEASVMENKSTGALDPKEALGLLNKFDPETRNFTDYGSNDQELARRSILAQSGDRIYNTTLENMLFKESPDLDDNNSVSIDELANLNPAQIMQRFNDMAPGKEGVQDLNAAVVKLADDDAMLPEVQSLAGVVSGEEYQQAVHGHTNNTVAADRRAQEGLGAQYVQQRVETGASAMAVSGKNRDTSSAKLGEETQSGKKITRDIQPPPDRVSKRDDAQRLQNQQNQQKGQEKVRSDKKRDAAKKAAAKTAAANMATEQAVEKEVEQRGGATPISTPESNRATSAQKEQDKVAKDLADTKKVTKKTGAEKA